MARPSALAVATLLAAGWAVGPALPALIEGKIIGHGLTDLYPSVWGMDLLADAWPTIPTSTDRLGAPGSVGFWYSSPIHGWLGAPLTGLFGPAMAYNLTLLLARFATVMAAFGWLRALGRQPAGALAGALLFGASPFFQGYAVEGIVEGTDGWALALWAWAVARKRPAFAAVLFSVTVLSSWYLGMVACLLALGAGLRWRGAWWSAAVGLVLASPALWSFIHAFGGNEALDPAVRVAMGSPLAIPTPGLHAGLQPFAITTYVGFAALLLSLPAAAAAPGFAIGGLVCAVLSTGRGPWWELPVLEMVRFPYRWHAGTLLCLAALVARTVEGLPWKSLGLLPWIEATLLSPIEPVLPAADASVPALYDRVTGPILLEVPGPVALPPGEPNPSRSRARYLLFAQTVHRANSPWVLDFNGIAHDRNAPWLQSFLAWDPVVDGQQPLLPDVATARATGVRQVMVHRDELRGKAPAFEAALVEAGAVLVAEDGVLALYGI